VKNWSLTTTEGPSFPEWIMYRQGFGEFLKFHLWYFSSCSTRVFPYAESSDSWHIYGPPQTSLMIAAWMEVWTQL